MNQPRRLRNLEDRHFDAVHNGYPRESVGREDRRLKGSSAEGAEQRGRQGTAEQKLIKDSMRDGTCGDVQRKDGVGRKNRSRTRQP